jgi:hypothetical protein
MYKSMDKLRQSCGRRKKERRHRNNNNIKGFTQTNGVYTREESEPFVRVDKEEANQN